MSQKYYELEFKKKIIRLRLEEGRTIPSICKEYGLARSTVSTWCKQFTEDCQNKATTSPDQTTDLDLMKENLRLHKELEEMKKEVLFLKKAAAFFAKEID